MNQLQVFQKINESITSVISEQDLMGFERAYKMSTAIKEIKSLLSDSYMAPILELQGTSLGFKTDKDKDKGYPVDVVRKCLIEAVFLGVQPYGNMFNIIAGNTYLTKEGLGYLLKNIEGLRYDIVFDLPRVNNTNSSAAIAAKISWDYKVEKGNKTIEIPIKVNSMMGTDAIIGKATRKARKWLYDYLTGSEIPEGDVYDLDLGKMRNAADPVNKEAERAALMIQDAKTIDELENIRPFVSEDQMSLFDQKAEELLSK